MRSRIWVLFLMVSCLASYSKKDSKDEISFMNLLLASNISLIEKILQPAVTRHGEFLFKKYALPPIALQKKKTPHRQQSAPKLGTSADLKPPQEATPKNLKKHLKPSTSSAQPIPAKDSEYIGPLRNIPKKNWKKKPGDIGLHDPVSQDLFFEVENMPSQFWERSGRETVTIPGKAPIEILLGLGRCLNEAACLTLSPSGRTIDLDSQVFVKPDFFAPQDYLLFKGAARRFDVQGTYQLIGDNINAPFNPITWNIKVRDNPSWEIVKKKRAIGLCLQLRNNTAFTVMTPRYTQEGKVKRSGTLVQDLEQKCSRYPFTFLSSFFVPG